MNPFRKPHNVTYQLPGQYVSGEWVAGEEQSSTIYCSVQPAKLGEDVLSLPEGRRISDYRRFYSDVLLPIPEDQEGQQPSLIYVGPDKYQIKERNPWQNGIINHYKYIAVRVMDG